MQILEHSLNFDVMKKRKTAVATVQFNVRIDKRVNDRAREYCDASLFRISPAQLAEKALEWFMDAHPNPAPLPPPASSPRRSR